MFVGAYPRPDSEWSDNVSESLNRHSIRTLEPLLPPPPLSRPLPSLPNPPRRSLLYPEWTLATHLVPAAYLRTVPYIPVPTIAPFTAGQDKQQRKIEINAVAQGIANMKAKQADGELRDIARDETALWCCVNRYARATAKAASGKGLTLFFAHANGFSREIWEPTLLHLTQRLRERDGSYEISEIWCFEAVNHGDSALVNAGKLSSIYDWQDHARDIAHFLVHYLPAASDQSLPLHLPRITPSISKTREQHGISDRTLVGVGHSFGGCSMIWTASHAPFRHLFSSMILVDPMVVGSVPAPGSDFERFVGGRLANALARRDQWSSREEALRLFQATPFFQRWDPAVLDVHIECGLYKDARGVTRLKVAPVQEAIVFAEQISCWEAWYHLANIDERIGLFFVMPSGNGEPGGPERTKEKQHLVWRRPVNASNVINPNAGHLIPQETPKQLAADIHEFLQRKYGMLKNRL